MTETSSGAQGRGSSPLLLHFLLLLALALVVSGLLLPAISVVALGFYTNSYSLLEGVLGFFEDGQVLLGMAVFAVSVLFPITKILVGFLVLGLEGRSAGISRPALSAMVWLSKWSLTDVFVLALAVMLIDGRLLTSADLHVGVALFAAGVVLSSVAIALLLKRMPAQR